MPISALTALAAPAAGIAAVKLAQHVSESRPFASLLTNIREPGEAASEEAGASDVTLQQQLDELAARVREQLLAAGVKTSIRFQLTLDANGRLRVAGSHPKKEQIERALAGADDLAREFAQLAQAQHGASTEATDKAFAQAYVDAATNQGNGLRESRAKQLAIEINGAEASIVSRQGG